MKLKFDANLPYQHDAVKAVVDIFEGQPGAQTDYASGLQADIERDCQIKFGRIEKTALQSKDKTLFDYIPYDSEVEREFARQLDGMEDVRLFVKLPRWFVVKTPIGDYNPDWAIVAEQDNKVYLVRETKSSLDDAKRRSSENQKIKCGKKHFQTLGVDFKTVTNAAEALTTV